MGKSRNAVLFTMIPGFGRSKSRLNRTWGAEPSGEIHGQKVAFQPFRSRKC